ncbi:MAG TPA: glycosyltransferase family 2 protein [Mycobacteriales bacterium]
MLSRVGVVTVTYASAPTIAACLTALPTEALGAVVVVDNSSPDDTVAVVESLALPGVTLVHRPNLGFGAGNNAGVAALPPVVEHVLFLNPDAVIAPADIERLAAYLDAHPSVAMAGPRLYKSGAPIHSAGRWPTPLTEIKPLLPRLLGRRLTDRRLDPAYDVTGPVATVEGACMMARRAALEAVGGFDQRFFLFFEELDLARRFAAKGWAVHLVAEASAEHLVAASREGTAHGARPETVRSQAKFFTKWGDSAVLAVWPRVARASWWLRARLGKLPAAERAALREALRDGLMPRP